ncbi:MAG: transporter, partial [Steroidobacteraceae bacterium]
MLVAMIPPAEAAEGGTGNYLLGKRGPRAAFVPKPGWYLTNDVIALEADRSELTPLGDRVVGN